MERFLKTILKTTLLAAAVVVAPLAVSAPAAAYTDVSVGFNTGDVDFAYRDGWYDRDRRWHRWHNDDESRWYRRHYSRHYYDYDHDRDDYWRSRYHHDNGWHRGWDRDYDHDNY
jgi:hypothetical protein